MSNSSYQHDVQNQAAFSSQILKFIFDFDIYHSSKGNQFKITKGALGDALKEMLCIPYILAHDAGIMVQGNSKWNYPLYIVSQQKLYEIELIIDRINQIIRSKIKESKIASTDIQHYHPGTTQVIVTVPIINEDDSAKLFRFVLEYAMFVTHVKFTFEDKNSKTRIEFPQLQNINSKWKTRSSICYYKLTEFHEFILGLDNNDLTVYDVLLKTFREASNMPRSQITQMTVGQLKRSPAQINRLYDELRNSMDAFVGGL